MFPELEQFNPYEDLSDEWHLFEQAKVAQFTADILRKDESEEGQMMAKKYDGDVDVILEELRGKSN